MGRHHRLHGIFFSLHRLLCRPETSTCAFASNVCKLVRLFVIDLFRSMFEATAFCGTSPPVGACDFRNQCHNRAKANAFARLFVGIGLLKKQGRLFGLSNSISPVPSTHQHTAAFRVWNESHGSRRLPRAGVLPAGRQTQSAPLYFLPAPYQSPWAARSNPHCLSS